jgi:hypothetical protein
MQLWFCPVVGWWGRRAIGKRRKGTEQSMYAGMTWAWLSCLACFLPHRGVKTLGMPSTHCPPPKTQASPSLQLQFLLQNTDYCIFCLFFQYHREQIVASGQAVPSRNYCFLYRDWTTTAFWEYICTSTIIYYKTRTFYKTYIFSSRLSPCTFLQNGMYLNTCTKCVS